MEKIRSVVFLAILGCLLLTIPAWAVDQGDGSGGGSNQSLSLLSSTPADGQKDVLLTGEIKLSFNKNVINLTIRDANKKCFSLVSVDGTKVPIQVIMADDQLHPEEKRNISVKPLTQIQPGTAYVLKISPQLQAKNGTSLGHEVRVNFVTAGIAPKPVEPAPSVNVGNNQDDATSAVSNPTENIVKPDSLPIQPAAEKVQAADEKEPLIVDQSSDSVPEKISLKSNRAYAAATGFVMLAGLGYLVFRRRNKK